MADLRSRLAAAGLVAEIEQPRAVFDWYAASIDAEPTSIVESLASWLDASWRPTRGLHGYTAGAEIVRDGNVVARIVYGGNDDAWPNAWASGSDAPAFAEAVRALWPAHRVSRVDVAYDFKDGEPWQRLYDMCLHVADHLPDGGERERPLKLTTVGDWLRPDSPAGRTLYVGSMKSPVMVRLYEKGKQMRAAFPDQLDKFPLGWVRMEIEVKPQKAARYEVAKLSPEEIWGTSRWAKQLHRDVFASDLAQVPVTYQRPRDDDRAWSFLLRQYGNLLRGRFDRLSEKHDGDPLELWAEIGRELGRALMSGDGAEAAPAPEQASVESIRKTVEERRATPVDSAPLVDAITADDHPGAHLDIGKRARAAIEAHGRATAEPRRRQPDSPADPWSPLDG